MSAINTPSDTIAPEAAATSSQAPAQQNSALPELEDFDAADDADSAFNDNISTFVFVPANHGGIHTNKCQWFDLAFVQRPSWPLREWPTVSGCEGRQLQHSQ